MRNSKRGTPINNYPYTHALVATGALCRVLSVGPNETQVQFTDGRICYVSAKELTPLTAFNHIPMLGGIAA